jgi:subtilisin family serine protease
MKKQYSLNFNQYTPVSKGSGYLFMQYEAIASFLRTNFKAHFHHVLLKPIKRENAVDFWSEDHKSYQEIEQLAPEQRTEILQKYNALIYEVEQRCKLLAAGTGQDDFSWASMLRKVFDMDSNILLSDGQDLRIIWGWSFLNKSSYSLPLAAFAHLLETNEAEEEPIVAEEVQDDHENNLETQPEIEDLATEPEVVEEPPSPLEQIEELPAHDNQEQMYIQEHLSDPEEPAEPLKDEGQKRTPPPRSGNAFTQFLDACERFGRKYWWLICLLLLLFLLFLLKDCSSPNDNKLASEMDPVEVEKIYNEIMPEHPRARKEPIQEEDLINDEESRARIVGNVVNIALKKKSDNFRNFAVDLKQAFPEQNYEVVYFDDQTRRLQFQFPEEKRADIKAQIKSKLSHYKILIWDEAIFETSRTFNDPLFSDRSASWPISLTKTDKAWETTTGDTSVIVAVIDDGFDLNHPELKGKVYKPYNVVTDNKQITSGPDRKHGTHVAGIIGAKNNNGKGICGIAPGCRLMPIQAAGQDGMFTMTDVIDGVLYAIKNNADVINMSLGKMFPEDIPPQQQEEIAAQYGKDEAQFWNELYQMAEENNVTIVIAAGNQDFRVGMDPMQRSQKVIKVAATDFEMKKANFSNFFSRNLRNGSCVSAPGVNIMSTIPSNQYEMMSGTSMASPIVAGIVALMKSVNPRLTNQQVFKILQETSLKNVDRKLGAFVQSNLAVAKARN